MTLVGVCSGFTYLSARAKILWGVEVISMALGSNNRVSRRSAKSTKGSLPRRPRVAPTSTEGEISLLLMGDVELQTLHVRVIALESLVVSLLASASDRQRNQATKMAAYIPPRSGATQHQLTIQATTPLVDIGKAHV